MGCSDSKPVENGSVREVHTNSPSKVNSLPQHVSSPEQKKKVTTVREWLEEALTPLKPSSQAYRMQSLPEHYIEEKIAFEKKPIDEKLLSSALSSKRTTQMSMDHQDDSVATSLQWSYKKSSVKYKESAEALTVDLTLEQGSSKQCFVAMSGLDLGGPAADVACVSEQLKRIEVSSIHSLILLGNVFDTVSGTAFHELPTDSFQLDQQADNLRPVLEAIRQIAENEGTTVYYLRGSRDAQLTRAATERLLGDKVIFVQQSDLVLAVKSGHDIYRVRFTSGRQWDMFGFCDLPNNHLICGKPISYYLYRAAAENKHFSILRCLQSLARSIPRELELNLIESASLSPIQEKLTQFLLLSAFQSESSESLTDAKCIISEGKYVTAETITQYTYLRFLLEKLGHERMMGMLKAVGGDYSKVLNGLTEDVVIIGEYECPSVGRISTKSGHDVNYAICGGLSARSTKMSMIRITYPKLGFNGLIETISCSQSETLKEAVPTSNGRLEETSTGDAKRDNTKADTISVRSLE